MTLAVPILTGKKMLVTGIANDQSIAYGCARTFRACGAELAITYLNDRAKPHVEPLARELGAQLLLPLDVNVEGSMRSVFDTIHEHWGRLDSALHSIAFAPKTDLQGRLVDCSREGFLTAVDVSCYSFVEMARLAEPLMREGGTLFTMSFHGARQVVDHYNVMGPAKAALEATVRYLAAELGHSAIRVYAISPGPIRTRAASGLAEFEELLQRAAEKAPAGTVATIDDVGNATAMLASEAGRMITGSTIYVDGGYHVVD
jgi:enoyl-[acyl-carrier protein] reductase I